MSILANFGRNGAKSQSDINLFMYLLHTARALPILCTCVQYWAPTRPICFVRGLLFATFCYFLLLFATFCYFLLLFATFWHFLLLFGTFWQPFSTYGYMRLPCSYIVLLAMLLFATFCYFLLLFATFCYFLLLFAVKSYLPLTALLDTTAPRYFTLLYTTISSKRKKT